MSPPLRPMNLGEILDRTFQIYRSRFLLFVALAAIPAIGTMIVEGAAYTFLGAPPESLSLVSGITTAELAYMLGFYHFAFFLQLLLWPSFVHASSERYVRDGPDNGLRSTLRVTLIRWRGSLALSTVLLVGVLIIPELVGGGLFIGIAYVTSEILKFDSNMMDLILPPTLLCIVLASWIAIGWMNAELSIAVPIRTVEKTPVRTAFRQAWKRARGSRFRIFVAWLMPALLGWVLTISISRMLLLLRGSCEDDFLLRLRVDMLAPGVQWRGWCVPLPIISALRIASDTAILALLSPIYPIALTLFYYDQRIRREGFDIEQMMVAAGLNPNPAPTAPEAVADAATPATVANATAFPDEGRA